MIVPQPAHVVVVGAGAAGLMAARELARAGRRVTVLEARERCGGRIYPLAAEEFGYPAEGGPEFVHGAAPVTRAVLREAGLALQRRSGTRWSTRSGALRPDDGAMPHAGRFYEALARVTEDLPIAEFLERHFAEPQYDALRRAITRTVEGYDAADPRRASTLALREEWLARDDGEHGRIAEGYGALIEHLARGCRERGAAFHFGAAVAAIDEAADGVTSRCRCRCSARSRCRQRPARAPRRPAISASATWSKSCCALPSDGGCTTAGGTSPICRSCCPTRPCRPGGRNIRRNTRC